MDPNNLNFIRLRPSGNNMNSNNMNSNSNNNDRINKNLHGAVWEIESQKRKRRNKYVMLFLFIWVVIGIFAYAQAFKCTSDIYSGGDARKIAMFILAGLLGPLWFLVYPFAKKSGYCVRK